MRRAPAARMVSTSATSAPATSATSATAATTATAATAGTAGAATSATAAAPKPLRVVRPRAPARPHKKLPDDVLKVRVGDTKKRLQVLRSKAVLMEDRLSGYEREAELRTSA